MKISYRPEIDGLRAIAVSAVILYHAKITFLGQQPFEGGFIGVDIFFVISGYLITSIILKELITTGSFSFKNFYERRVRRILPPLLFVMIVSLPFAWMYLLPSSFIDFSKSVLYSLGFSSNFYFHYSGQEYGAEDSLLIPFLHTWSLSVEEQFYILFPIILLVVFRYFKKYLIHILILGFFISLGLADWGSKNYPSFYFYILPSRVWELLAGSFLAYYEIKLGHRSKQKTLNLILPSTGLILIFHSIFFFNDKIFHPSFYTLSPIIGVCLIIWFSNKGELITNMLSTKLFVGIGLISYSLYLWHYPIFAFARISELTPKGDILIKLFFGILILILSIFSFFFIERPFREKNNKFKTVISFIIISIIIIIILNLSIIINNGFKNRLPKVLENTSIERPWNLLKNLDGESCFEIDEGCKFNTSSKNKVFINGDSIMGSIMLDLKNRFVKKDYQFITTNCLYFPGFDRVIIKTSKIHKKCHNKHFQKLRKTFLKETNSIIIFGGRLPLYLDNSKFDNKEGGIEIEGWGSRFIPVGKYNSIANSFKEEVLELSKKNKIVLIYPIPEVGWYTKKLIWLKRKNKLFKNLDLKEIDYITTSYQTYKDRTKSSFHLLDSIQGENIYRVFPHLLFCNTIIKDRCISHDKENVFYFDDIHPSVKGAEIINDLLLKEIEKIELNNEN